MKVSQLQRVDCWCGIPACFALTVLQKLFGGRTVSAGQPIKKVLFVKLAEQGSTVLAYPAIKSAINKVGRENVYFIVFDDNRFILDAMDVIPRENVITVSFHHLPVLLASTLGAILKLRRLKFDAVIDMEFFSRGSAVVTYLSGAKYRVGFHPFFNAGPYRGDLMTHRLLYSPHLHTSQTFRLMVDALNHDPAILPTMNVTSSDEEIAPPSFAAQPEELDRVGKMVRGALPDCDRLVLLNPNGSDLLPLRRWPSERYVEVAQRILTQWPNAGVIFTGAPAEADTARDLARSVGFERCISMAGKTSLRELLVLFAISDVLVTNDSGPAHFASLTSIQVVTLFGPETPSLYSARSSRNVPLWAGLVCSPCINAFNGRQSPCRNNLCMQSISVEQVFVRIGLALKEKSMGVQPSLRPSGMAS